MLVCFAHIYNRTFATAGCLWNTYGRPKVHQSLVKVARSIVRQSLLYDSRNSLFTFSAQNIIKDAIQPSIDAQYIAIYSHLWFVVRHG